MTWLPESVVGVAFVAMVWLTLRLVLPELVP